MEVNGFKIEPQSGSAGTHNIGVSPTSVNEGLDKVVEVNAECGDKSARLTLVHEGLRERYITADGNVFCVADGGRFAVLKEGTPDTPDIPVEPDEPNIETYTRLTYIECTSEQYFNSGYVIKETDTIEAYYETDTTSVDKVLYCSSSTKGAVWLSLYSTYAYVRFGNTSSTSIGNGSINHYIKVQQKSVTLDVTTTALTFEGMPADPLYIFGGYNASSGLYDAYAGRCTMLRITDGDSNVVMELRPAKRDSDGKVGMLDLKSGKFFTNEGDGADFIGGAELNITEEYEIMDRVSFNNDIAFDTGFNGNEQTYIDVMFQRTDTSGADYMFGCSSGNRLTAYLSSSGYWRYGSAAPTFNTNSKKIYVAAVAPTKTNVDRTSRSRSVSAFTTAKTIPLGGHKASTSSDTITRAYQGHIYYFRMKHGDDLLVDWYPCRRKTDGEIGFWDCVTQNFVEKV